MFNQFNNKYALINKIFFKKKNKIIKEEKKIKY